MNTPKSLTSSDQGLIQGVFELRTFFVISTGALIVCNGISMVFRALEKYPDLQTAAYTFLASWDALLFFFCECS